MTSADGYRKIAKKFGVSLGAVEMHGKRDGWVEKRRNYQEPVVERILEENKEAAVRRTQRLLEVGDQLLCKVEEVTAVSDTPAALKTLAEALKNIRDAQMLKEGRQEQRGGITVTLEEVADFAA